MGQSRGNMAINRASGRAVTSARAWSPSMQPLAPKVPLRTCSSVPPDHIGHKGRKTQLRKPGAKSGHGVFTRIPVFCFVLLLRGILSMGLQGRNLRGSAPMFIYKTQCRPYRPLCTYTRPCQVNKLRQLGAHLACECEARDLFCFRFVVCGFEKRTSAKSVLLKAFDLVDIDHSRTKEPHFKAS